MPKVSTKKTATAAIVFAAVNCGWLLALMLAFYSYWNDWPIVGASEGASTASGINLNHLNLPRRLYGHDPIGGVVPAYVPWAGALGGVTISLIGCAKWSRDWDPKWNVWHALRPVLGAVSGSVGFIIVVLVLRTAAGTDSTLDSLPTNPISQATFFMIAYLVGFRDRLFLELISNVTKTIFTTGEEEEVRATFTLDPDVLVYPDLPIGDTSQLPVRVTLTNPKATVDLPDGWFKVIATRDRDREAFMAKASTAEGLAAQYRDILVDFAPHDGGEYAAVLRVVVGDVERDVEIRGTAT